MHRDNISPSDTDLVGLLGCVPHTIRGSLWNYDTHLTITHRFTSCTACSVPIIAEYKNRGLAFVLDACNVPNYLEKLSGVEQILKRPDLDEVYSKSTNCVQPFNFSIVYYIFNCSFVTHWIIQVTTTRMIKKYDILNVHSFSFNQILACAI